MATSRHMKLVALTFVGLCAVAVPCRAELVLVDKGQNPCPIVLAAQPSQQEQKAAEQLARYLKEISGATFPVQTAADPVPERAILVGPPDPGLAARVGGDGFVLRTEGQRLHIVGSSAGGTAYGVYGFLEDVLGCRWWSYTEEDVPKLPTIVVPDLNREAKPAFVMHHLFNIEAQSTTNDFRLKARSVGLEGFTGSHSLYPLLTPYGKDHPEIYPMGKNGERKANNLHFCYLAPGIAEALAEALGRQVESRKGAVRGVIYFAGMGDWYGGMCECPECKKVYEEEMWTDPDGGKKPGYTATLLKMINRAAEILEAKYPGVRVGTFAYMSLEAPPAKTVPGHNVVIRVPRLRHCTVHDVETCESNRSYLRNLERWLQITPAGVYIWEYGTNFKNFIFPFPCAYSMADNIRLYHKLGVRGLEIQGNYVTPGSDLVVLKNYVWRRLMWNPDLAPQELVREFCKGYYGPASDAMVEYVSALENSVREPKLIHADEFAGPAYLTAEAREQLRRWRQKALAAAGEGEPFLRRVKEATVGLETLDLSTPGALQERDGQLVGKNLGQYSLPRAMDVLSYVRNSGSNEWSSGKGYWVNFLASNGGPLYTLSHGPVEVKVAPTSRLIRQISYKGKGLLCLATDPSEKGYPLVGGSAIAFGEPLFGVVGEPSPNKVQLLDGVEVPNWRFSSRGSIEVTLEMDDEGRIVMSGVPRPGVKPKGATVTTVYPVAGTLADMDVQYRTPEGEWKKAVIPADATELLLPGASALRLRFGPQGCVLLDEYLSPGVENIKLTVDTEKKRLSAAVTTSPLSAGPKEKASLLRKIQILPGEP